MAVQREDLADQVAYLFVAALEEHQDRRPGAAESATKQARGAQFQNVAPAQARARAGTADGSGPRARSEMRVVVPVASAAISRAARCTLKIASSRV